MTCAKHNLTMLRLVLRGQVRTPAHAELLADVRRCRRCSTPEAAARDDRRRESPRVPKVRVEQSVRELEHTRR